MDTTRAGREKSRALQRETMSRRQNTRNSQPMEPQYGGKLTHNEIETMSKERWDKRKKREENRKETSTNNGQLKCYFN